MSAAPEYLYRWAGMKARTDSPGVTELVADGWTIHSIDMRYGTLGLAKGAGVEAEWVMIFPGYLVSRNGQVVSLRYSKQTPHPICLKILLNTGGYPQVGVYINGRQTTQMIHTLVAEAFLGPRRGRQVNHKNGVKTDNRVENLEWCTASENRRHAYAIGLQIPRGPEGELARTAKFRNTEIVEIKKIIGSGRYADAAIARVYGVSRSTIGAIRHGRTWRYV